MATSKKSLASRAGSVVRRAVGGRADASSETRSADGAGEKAAATEKAPARKAPAKVAAKQSPAKKAPARTTAKKATATTAPAEAAATKTPAKKTATKKTAAKKAPAKKTAAKKAPAGTAPAAKKTAATTKAAAQKTPVTKAPAKKTATKKTAAKKAPAKKTAAKKAPARTSAKRSGGVAAAALVVREGESPWTEAELDEVRTHLRGDIERISAELTQADTGLHDLMVDSGDGSGHDQADVGSSSFERDHELSIANNARDMLTQSQHALERIEDGSYGVCEHNQEPIGKLRLMAFPRATLCMPCKQREERR